MGQKRQVQIDGSKETDPNRRVQIDWSKKTEWSKYIQIGPKSNQKVSKGVPHNQVSWSSFYSSLLLFFRCGNVTDILVVYCNLFDLSIFKVIVITHTLRGKTCSESLIFLYHTITTNNLLSYFDGRTIISYKAVYSKAPVTLGL